jgi:hypothetical protein
MSQQLPVAETSWHTDNYLEIHRFLALESVVFDAKYLCHIVIT